MNDVQFTGQGWAMEPGALKELAARSIDLEAVSVKQGTPLARPQSVEVRDGVAILEITGPLFKRGSWISSLVGGSSIEQLARDFKTALDDPKVKAIMLDIDSPGGQVNGLAELSRSIRAARDRKPILAYVSGSGASGAYWLGSAASRIYASETAILGSIGVVSSYLDRSKADEAAGIRRIEVISSQSPDKRLTPTDDRGLAAEQELVDDLAAVFVAQVAENRGVSEEKVLSDFGQGGVKVGAAAVQAGLADGLGDFESVLASLAQGKTPEPQRVETRQDFMSLVEAHQKAHGCTRGEAYKAMARKHPEAYKAHEFGGKEQDREPQPKRDNSGFMTLVQTLEKNRGMTRAEAIREAARRCPEAHRRYIEEYNQIGG